VSTLRVSSAQQAERGRFTTAARVHEKSQRGIRVLNRRTIAVSAVGLALLALFMFVAIRSGPLAPIAVTITTVEARSVAPAIFGIGTVESNYS
jgi:hypothetical protein